MQPILGIHNPKNIHDTMGWKLNFQLLHQIFYSSCQTAQKPWTDINMKKENERNQQKKKKRNGNVLRHYLCTSLSLVI
jgi:hypothetical protein